MRTGLQEPGAPTSSPQVWTRAFFWTLGRLRGRQDTEHEITPNRLMFAGTIVLSMSVAAWAGNKADAIVLQATYKAFAVYYVVSLMLFAHIVWRPGRSAARRLLGIACDFTMISYIAAAGGL